MVRAEGDEDPDARLTRQMVYSFGYAGHKVEPFVVRVRALGAVVVDTRLKPFSRMHEWNKSRLTSTLGDAYMWVDALGNRNYKGGPIDIVNLELGLARVEGVLASRPVVLLCVCGTEATCHRRVVLDALAHRGYPIREFS